MTWKEMFKMDCLRYGEGGPSSRYIKKFLFYYRGSSLSNSILKYFYKFRYKKLSEEHFIEIPLDAKIGAGLYIGHPYCITLNKSTVIGNNVNIHKGVTIGQENRGKRKGAPIIGNNVWIGINSTIVGSITIGDDVLIAPNTYINCNVPSHSIVFGNPCIIKQRENATLGYINNPIPNC